VKLVNATPVEIKDGYCVALAASTMASVVLPASNFGNAAVTLLGSDTLLETAANAAMLYVVAG
jgi:hypothetical protein